VVVGVSCWVVVIEVGDGGSWVFWGGFVGSLVRLMGPSPCLRGVLVTIEW